MLSLSIGKTQIQSTFFNVPMTPEDYLEFQLRLILGKKVQLVSRGELKSLSYMYLYPSIKEATNRLVEANIRNSKKSVDNDLSRFRGLNWIRTEEDAIIFNEDMVINKETGYYLIRVQVE